MTSALAQARRNARSTWFVKLRHEQVLFVAMMIAAILAFSLGGPCAGDVCGAGMDHPDGAVDINDIDYCLGNWGGQNEAADTNADGVVNVQDLIIQLRNWGVCQSGQNVVTWTWASASDLDAQCDYSPTTLGDALALTGDCWDSNYQVLFDGGQPSVEGFETGSMRWLYGSTNTGTFPVGRVQFNLAEMADLRLAIFLSNTSSPPNSFLRLNRITTKGTELLESWCIGTCTAHEDVEAVVEDLASGQYYFYFIGSIGAGPPGAAVGVQWWVE